MYVEIGNDKALEGYRDPNSDDPDLVRYRAIDGQRITSITLPDEVKLQEAFVTVVAALEHHIQEGERPTWVESDSEGLQNLLVEHFGITANKRTKSWGDDTGAALVVPPGVVATTLMALWAFMLFKLLGLELRTDAGRDYQARVMGDTASTGTGNYAPASYIGVTANATAPAAGSTTLTGEIVTGTLVRAQATYAHTNGTATYTLTKTFTSDQSVTIAKIGVFNNVGPGGAASASNTLVFETLLNATATLVSGDQLQVTETVTL